MRYRINEQIRLCHEHADECARQAQKVGTPTDLCFAYLDCERHWLLLAEQYQFAANINAYMEWASRRLAPPDGADDHQAPPARHRGAQILALRKNQTNLRASSRLAVDQRA